MFISVAPKLPFINKPATLDFYVKLLGFTMVSDYGDYFILKQDAVELHFFDYPNLDPQQSDFMIYIRLDRGIGELYSAYVAKNVPIHPNGQLNDKPWKQREFALSDPSGTLLTFGQSL